MTAQFLTSMLGFQQMAAENGWTRYGCRGGPGVIDVRDAPEARRGAWGVGAVHHLAWRVDDEEHQLDVRTRVEGAGAHPTTVIDRFWFKSGVLQGTRRRAVRARDRRTGLRGGRRRRASRRTAGAAAMAGSPPDGDRAVASAAFIRGRGHRT